MERVPGTPAPTLPGESPPGPTRRSRRASHPPEVDEEVMAENRLGPQERIDYWRDVASVPTPVQGAGPGPLTIMPDTPVQAWRRAAQAESRDRSRGRDPRPRQDGAETGSDETAVYRILLWDRPRSASMFGLHHGSRRTPGQTPPRMPRKHSGQRFCKGGPSSNTGQTLPFVHHDTMTSRYAQSWDIRVTDFPDPFCTLACWLYVHLSSSFSANALRVPQVLEATALCVGRSASGSAHLWASTRMHHESQCFHLFSFVLSAASTSNCLQSEASQALRVAGSIFRPWRQWLHYAALAISLDVRNSAHVGLICTLTYRYLSHVAVVCAGLRLSISVPVPLPWIAQCHPHSALLPVGPVFPDLPKGRAGSASAVVG